MLNTSTSHLEYDYGGTTYKREYFTSYPDKVSGTVLIKNIVRYGYSFGIEPDLKGVKITPAGYILAKQAEITLNIKGCEFTVKYENTGSKKREISLNGEKLPLRKDELSGSFFVEISKKDFMQKNTVMITD